MTPYKQLNRHRPNEGVIGDCWRTAIGCLLDLPPDQVPHFCDGDAWDKTDVANAATRAWLLSRGYGFVEFAFSGQLEQILQSIAANSPRAYYLLGGNSRNGVGHVVICCDDGIVWDTSLDDSGIVGPGPDGFYWITFLVPAQIVRSQ